MFQLMQALRVDELTLRQLPVFGAAMAIATVFYKFGNFALECLAFLATWYLLDAVIAGALASVRRLRGPDPATPMPGDGP